MKLIILQFFLITNLTMAGTTLPPRTGVYRCVDGNNNSVCDQNLKLKMKGDQLEAISVEYVGECISQGPYTYSCLKGRCTDSVIEIKFINEDSYRWENVPYKIRCKMERF